MRKGMKKCRVKSTRGWVSGRPWKGGPAARPYYVGTGWLIETVGGNGVFDDPVSLIFRCTSDSNVVGAPRRGAHPRPPRGMLCTLHLCPNSSCPYPLIFCYNNRENFTPKKCSSKNSPFYYHFYYYNGESCAVFCKIMSFYP